MTKITNPLVGVYNPSYLVYKCLLTYSVIMKLKKKDMYTRLKFFFNEEMSLVHG